jgi:hypothetical protein
MGRFSFRLEKSTRIIKRIALSDDRVCIGAGEGDDVASNLEMRDLLVEEEDADDRRGHLVDNVESSVSGDREGLQREEA